MRRHLYPKAGAPGKKKIRAGGGLAFASKIGQLLPVVTAGAARRFRVESRCGAVAVS
jgi:hypothetical protein